MNDKVNDYFDRKNVNTNCQHHTLFTLPHNFLPHNFLPFPSKSSHEHLPTCPRHQLAQYFPQLQSASPSKLPDPLTQRFHCNFTNCDKHYKRVEHLKRHVKSTHLLKQPYLCPILNCGKKFTRKDNMKQHIKRHNSNNNNNNK